MHVRVTVILNFSQVSMNILSALDLLQTGKNAHQRSDKQDSPAAPQLWIGEEFILLLVTLTMTVRVLGNHLFI